MLHTPTGTARRAVGVLAACLAAASLAACAAGSVATPTASLAQDTPAATDSPATSQLPTETAAVTARLETPQAVTPSPAAETAAASEPPGGGGTTTGGDIPDNAVFLHYKDKANGFNVDYVEGWQVSPTADGVSIRDKDSSEIVQVVPGTVDATGYITGTDLPALQATDGYKLKSQDTVKLNGTQVDHIQYDQLAPPDPVTNKRVSSLVDRYYFVGANGLGVLTMSTPKGVDNVDAFRQMAQSFTWR